MKTPEDSLQPQENSGHTRPVPHQPAYKLLLAAILSATGCGGISPATPPVTTPIRSGDENTNGGIGGEEGMYEHLDIVRARKLSAAALQFGDGQEGRLERERQEGALFNDENLTMADLTSYQLIFLSNSPRVDPALFEAITTRKPKKQLLPKFLE